MVLVFLGKKRFLQGSLLEPLLFLTYINDLPHDISLICRMFANDAPLFSKVKDASLFLSDLDLETINQWAHQWKMSFNPDPNK